MSQNQHISEQNSKPPIKNKINDALKPCMGLLLVFWIIFVLAMVGHYGGLY